MGGDNDIVDLVVAKEGAGLAQFCSNEEAEGCANYASSCAEDEI